MGISVKCYKAPAELKIDQVAFWAGFVIHTSPTGLE